MSKTAEQLRKPSGLAGRLAGWMMAHGNKPMYSRLLQGLDIHDGDRLLEIGFGPGVMLQMVGKANASCQVDGIDYSELMCVAASRRNKKLIQDGRTTIISGDFFEHDFGDITYTKVYCTNVIYFWSDPGIAFKKICGILEPGGMLAIGMGKAEDMAKRKMFVPGIFNIYPESDVVTRLQDAGIENVDVQRGNTRIGEVLYIFARKA